MLPQDNSIVSPPPQFVAATTAMHQASRQQLERELNNLDGVPDALLGADVPPPFALGFRNIYVPGKQAHTLERVCPLARVHDFVERRKMSDDTDESQVKQTNSVCECACANVECTCLCVRMSPDCLSCIVAHVQH